VGLKIQIQKQPTFRDHKKSLLLGKKHQGENGGDHTQAQPISNEKTDDI
jgi:hypothetical protein